MDIESCNGRSFGASMCSFGYALADADLTLTEQKDILINPLPKKFMLGRPGETSKITLSTVCANNGKIRKRKIR